MKKQTTNTAINRIANTLLVALLAIGFGTVLYASVFIHPNAEDILIAQKWRDQGILSASVNMLLGYDGRYFTNVLHGLSPLAMGWYDGFKITPAIILILLMVGSTLLIRQIAPNALFSTQLLHACLLVLSGVAIAPCLADQLFVYIGCLVYFLPWAFVLMYCGLFVTHLRRDKDVVCLVASAAFLIMGNGMSEMFLVINLGILLLLGEYTWRTNPDREKKLSWLALCIVYAGTSLFFMLSPGITQRLGDYAQVRAAYTKADVWLFAMHEFWWMYMPRFFSRAWGAIPVAILLASFVHTSQPNLPRWSFKKTITYILVGLLFLHVSTYAYYFTIATYNANADRIYNTVYFAMLLIAAGAFLALLQQFRQYFTNQKISQLRLAAALLLAVNVLNPYNNFNRLISDLHSGSISRFDKQIQQRLQAVKNAQVNEGCKTASFIPLTEKPATVWHNTDLVANRQESFWNRGYERYFFIDEVRLVGDTVGLFNNK